MDTSKKNKDDYYYDAMECLEGGDSTRALRLLQQALALDRNSIQTHLGIAEAYHVKNDKVRAYDWINKAFEKIRIEFPDWPKQMPWGDLDNRAYLRVIAHKADFLCDEGRLEEATALYKVLLKLNPNDNQGIRYILAGLYEGITGEDINRMFDEGNATQDWSKLEDLVRRQNTIHKFWKKPR